MAEQKLTVAFDYEKDTPNKKRFKEDSGDEAPHVGTLYMGKHTFKKLGEPDHIEVDLRAVKKK